MRSFTLRTDIERHRIGRFQLPLGLEPIDLPAPSEGYTIEFVEGDDNAPDVYRFYAVTSFEKVSALLDDLFQILPGEIFPLVEVGSKDAFRTMDIFSAREPMQLDEFLEDWREYRQVILEDGSIGAGAQADEPYMEVFVDSWKGVDVQVAPDMKDDIEQLMARHGLEEVAHTWPPEVDERPEPPLNVREILVLDSEECPDIDEILFQLREAWGLELDVDLDENLDEGGRRLGRTLWHAVAIVESADDDSPRAGYALAWASASSMGELQRMLESRMELQDEWRFNGQWYAVDRVAFDERPDSLAALPPRPARSEVHEFRIEPA